MAETVVEEIKTPKIRSCKVCGELDVEKLVKHTKLCKKCKYHSQKDYMKDYYVKNIDHYKELQANLYQNFYKHSPKYVKTGKPCGRKPRPIPTIPVVNPEPETQN